MRLSTLPRLRRLRSGALALVRLRRPRSSALARWSSSGELLALVATAPVQDPEAPPEEETPPEEGAPGGGTPEAPGNPAPADRTPVDEQLPPPEGGVPFTIPVVMLEGYRTSDDRFWVPGSVGRRALPQTLMAMRRNPDGGFDGHDAAIVAGRIDTLERYDASAVTNPETGQPYGPDVWAWRATGWLISDTEDTASTVRYVRDGVLRGISADLGEAEGEMVVEEEDEEGYPEKVLIRYTQSAIAQATICPFQAFPGSYIVLGDEQAEEVEPPAVAAAGQPGTLRVTGDAGCVPCEAGRNLVAAGGPDAPPRAWFERPEPDELTPWTVLESGECFGHLAPWDACHTGVGDACVTAPRGGPEGYGLFHSGAVLTSEGEEVAVGHITLGGGHANINLGVAPAIQHYDDAGAATADVRATDGRHGIWLSGAVRPEATELQVRQLRAHALSGDWRRDARGGPLRLVAALCVNVPGFPVPRERARVAGGAPQSLVAAGASLMQRRQDRARAGGVDPDLVEATVNRLMAPLIASAARPLLDRLTRPRG